MSKAVELIEKNVQYVTVGLGGAFVLFMAYRYVYNTPTAELSGRTFTAGQIDPYVANNIVPQLEGRMNAPGRPEIPLPTFDAQFREAFAGPRAGELAGAWTLSRGLGIDLPTGGAGTVPSRLPTDGPAATGGPVVKAAPTLPAGIPIGTSTGISLVNVNSLVPVAQAAGVGVMGGAAMPPAMQQPGGMGFGGLNEFGSAGPGDPGVGAAPGGGGFASRQPVRPGGAAAPAAPAAPVAGQTDKTWVTAAFEVPMESLANAFVDADVPAGLVTMFLRVEVQREEQLPDGSWGNATLVRPLTGSPLALNPLPAPGNIAQETNYRSFAEGHQSEILQPGFYAILGGANWRMPGAPTGPGVTGAPFDPRRYLEGPIPSDLSKDERDAVMRERAREAQRKAEEERQRRIEQNRNRPQPGMGGPPGGFPGGWPGGPGGGGGWPGGPGGGGRGGRGGGGFLAPVPPKFSLGDPAPLPGGTELVTPAGAGTAVASGAVDPWTLPTSFSHPVVTFEGLLAGLSLQTGGFGPPAGRPPGYPPNLPWPPPGFVPPTLPGGVRPPGMPGGSEFPGAEESPSTPPVDGGGQPVPQPMNLGTIPPGAFDPGNWADATLITFQHDDQVQPGKTYRYRMRYIMLNPVYGQLGAAAEPRIAQQFRWESEWSSWTDGVTVPLRVSFFVSAPITTGANSVSMEVFQFVRGRMTSRTFNLQPGDLIGWNDPAGGDFATGHTVVDIRRDPARNENYVLILTPDGSLIRRDGNDRSSQQYLDLRRQLNAPGPVGAAGN